jgi:peroxiredoxin
MLPETTLTAVDGRPVSFSEYRHSRNLIVALLGGPGEVNASQLVPQLKTEYGAIKEAAAEVLIVLRGSPGDAAAAARALSLPFPVLADEDGRAHARFGAPAAYVADRFGEIHFQAHAADGPLPSALDLLGWLNYIELLCPE